MFHKRKLEYKKKNDNETDKLLNLFIENGKNSNDNIELSVNISKINNPNQENEEVSIKNEIKLNPLIKTVYKNPIFTNKEITIDNLEKNNNDNNLHLNESNKKDSNIINKNSIRYNKIPICKFLNSSASNLSNKIIERINTMSYNSEKNSSLDLIENNKDNSNKNENEIQNDKKLGPIKLTNNIRGVNQIDYAMGICTDFKRTGYCGYGDNCIFLHDRSEIKSSWEIDREIKKAKLKELEMLKKGININTTELFTDKNKLKEEITCPICKKELKSPVSTICNHLYCEECINDYYKNKSKACLICNKHLKGVFNSSKLADLKLSQYKEKYIEA